MLAEVRAQLSRFVQLMGFEATHIDGHQHVHVLPPVAAAIAVSGSSLQTARIPLEAALCDDFGFDWMMSAPNLSFLRSVCAQAVGPHVRVLPPPKEHAFVGLSLMGFNLSVGECRKRRSRSRASGPGGGGVCEAIRSALSHTPPADRLGHRGSPRCRSVSTQFRCVVHGFVYSKPESRRVISSGMDGSSGLSIDIWRRFQSQRRASARTASVSTSTGLRDSAPIGTPAFR